MNKISKKSLKIDSNFYDFINDEVIPGTGIDQDGFWSNFDKVVNELAPKNKELIIRRDEIQKKIDGWHKENDFISKKAEYLQFLKSIGYLVKEMGNFKIQVVRKCIPCV